MNTDKIKRELAEVLNRNSVDNELSTPDFILADYLYTQLKTYGTIKINNEQWHKKGLDSPAPQDEKEKPPADYVDDGTRPVKDWEKPKDIKEQILNKHLFATAKESNPSLISPKAFEEIYEAMDEYLSRKKQELIDKIEYLDGKVPSGQAKIMANEIIHFINNEL